MKLYEIKDYLTGIKLRRTGWIKDSYIYFNETCWINYDNAFFTAFEQLQCGDWEIYQEKKRYWIWKIKEGNWYKSVTYVDENGLKTDGCKYCCVDWNKIERIKCEDDFIDV